MDRSRFNREVASDYERGRQMTASEIRTWTHALADAIASRSSAAHRILDLGSGTGRFSPAIAEQCNAQVFGVEPSADMRRVAQEVNPHPRVTYIAGYAEAIPLLSHTCDAAFLFLSIHHFRDIAVATEELARVVRVGAPILIRTEFSDRPHLTFWHGLLPRGAEIDRSLYPAFTYLATTLDAAGISVDEVRNVPYLASDSLGEYVDRLHLLSLSALRMLGKEETERDLSTLDFHHAELREPIVEIGHLLVCRRR